MAFPSGSIAPFASFGATSQFLRTVARLQNGTVAFNTFGAGGRPSNPNLAQLTSGASDNSTRSDILCAAITLMVSTVSPVTFLQSQIEPQLTRPYCNTSVTISLTQDPANTLQRFAAVAVRDR